MLKDTAIFFLQIFLSEKKNIRYIVEISPYHDDRFKKSSQYFDVITDLYTLINLCPFNRSKNRVHYDDYHTL